MDAVWNEPRRWQAEWRVARVRHGWAGRSAQWQEEQEIRSVLQPQRRLLHLYGKKKLELRFRCGIEWSCRKDNADLFISTYQLAHSLQDSNSCSNFGLRSHKLLLHQANGLKLHLEVMFWVFLFFLLRIHSGISKNDSHHFSLLTVDKDRHEVSSWHRQSAGKD